ncbi:MAG TPA: hypothetical protein VKY42_04170 [Trueperaceae bacterium]|nr:hypothetical protein [Trueperaceae bacterium]
MSPLGLLAFLFAVVTFGGSALVFLHDLIEARLAGEPVPGGGRSRRRVRVRTAGVPRAPRSGVVVTVRAGAAPAASAGRGEVASR